MVEIENFYRIRASHLKPLFTNVRRLRLKAEAMIREQHPSTEEEAILIRREIVSSSQGYLTGTLSRGELSFEIVADVDFIETIEVERLLFKWEYRGRHYSKSIAVESRPSNLGLSAPVYFFVCPYSGALCSKLYTDGDILSGRRGFRHTYRDRNLSHNSRDNLKLYRMVEGATIQRNRKKTYRGKPTRYGKRLRDSSRACLSMGGIERVLALSLCVRWSRGRPRKGR